jgi:hypothetical protein
MTPQEAFELGAAIRARHDSYTSDSSDHVRVGIAVGIRVATNEFASQIKPPHSLSEFRRGLGDDWQHVAEITPVAA